MAEHVANGGSPEILVKMLEQSFDVIRPRIGDEEAAQPFVDGFMHLAEGERHFFIDQRVLHETWARNSESGRDFEYESRQSGRYQAAASRLQDVIGKHDGIGFDPSVFEVILPLAAAVSVMDSLSAAADAF